MLASGPVADASLKSRPTTLAYQRISADGLSRLRIYNFNDERKGFVLYSGEDVVGYSPEGNFSEETAPPALMVMLESFSAPEVPEAAEDGTQSLRSKTAGDMQCGIRTLRSMTSARITNSGNALRRGVWLQRWLR